MATVLRRHLCTRKTWLCENENKDDDNECGDYMDDSGSSGTL